MYNLVIAPSAEDDLHEIVGYIVSQLCNPIAANALLDEIEKCYDILESFPGSFPFCRDSVLRANKYRQIEVNGYVMIFRIEEENETVRVLHFYHGTQDYLKRIKSVTL